MKILYLTQYFSTHGGSYGTRAYEIAKRMVETGHEVNVVSSIYYKSDIKSDKLFSKQKIEGINLFILNIPISNKESFFKRIQSFLGFSVFASVLSFFIKTDIVYASSGPLTIGIPALVAKYFRRRNLVFEVRDLWPEVAIELGILKNSFLKRLSFKLEKQCYYGANLIVALSPGMKKNILDRFPRRNIISIPNFSIRSLFNQNHTGEIPKIFKERKVIIYTGNIGEVNNSILLFEAAKILREKKISEFHFLLIGDGQLKELLVKKTKEAGLDNFEIWESVPKSELVIYLKNSFLSIVPLKGNPILDTSSPNKLFDSLAAGVPVVQNTNGWLKDLLKDHNCGFTVSPNDPNELVDLLIELSQSDIRISELKKNALKLAESDFDVDKQVSKLIKIIEKTFS